MSSKSSTTAVLGAPIFLTFFIFSFLYDLCIGQQKKWDDRSAAVPEEDLKRLASRYVQDIVLKATELAAQDSKLNANKSSKSIRKSLMFVDLSSFFLIRPLPVQCRNRTNTVARGCNIWYLMRCKPCPRQV